MAAEKVGMEAPRLGRGAGVGAFGLGLLMLLLGVIALGSAAQVGLLSVVFVGVIMFIAGAIEIIHAFTQRGSANRLLYLLSGILSAVVGALLVTRAGLGLVTVTLMLAAYFIVNGLFHGIAALMDRYQGWMWDLVLGLASTALGVMVFARWPVSSLWLVGTLVGIEIVFRGWALILVGMKARRITRGTQKPLAA